MSARGVRPFGEAEAQMLAVVDGLVQQASRTKARTQLFIEKAEQRYSVGMVALFVIPLLWGEPLREALLRAMTFGVASRCLRHP